MSFALHPIFWDVTVLYGKTSYCMSDSSRAAWHSSNRSIRPQTPGDPDGWGVEFPWLWRGDLKMTVVEKKFDSQAKGISET